MTLTNKAFPDSMSATIADRWRSGAVKALEHQNAAVAQPEPLAS
jgi:hypothetical protein